MTGVTAARFCRVCYSSKVVAVLDLGDLCVSDFVPTPDTPGFRVPHCLIRCVACGLVQLSHSVDRDRLYKRYWYRCIAETTRLFARVNGHLMHEEAGFVFGHDHEVELPCMTLDGRMVWQKVSWRKRQRQDVYTVEFSTGAQVTVSGHHRWSLVNDSLTWKRERSGNPAGAANAQKETVTLVKGDRVPQVTIFKRPEGTVDEGAIYTEDTGYVVGAYLAEGCSKDDKGYMLTLHAKKDVGMAARVAEHVTGALNEGCAQTWPRSPITNLYLSGPVLRGIMEKFVRGRLAWGKRLRPDVWGMPLSFIQGIVDGWLDGDGSWDEANGRWVFQTCANVNLIEDIALGCRLLGWPIHWRQYQTKENGKQRYYIHGWVRKSWERTRLRKQSGGFTASSVQRVWKVPEPKWTWDIHVGGDELFCVGNGIVTHNSGINETMVAALGDVVRGALRYTSLEEDDHVLDIGSNDNTLLMQYPSWVRRIGVDPSDVAANAVNNCTTLIRDYWPLTLPVPRVPMKVITSIAVFYDVDDPVKFISEIKAWLHPDGVWVVQYQDLEQMLGADAVDNICAEHVLYPSYAVMNEIIESCQLRIIGWEKVPVNGGSIRLYVQHTTKAPMGAPSPYAPIKPFLLNAFAAHAEANKKKALAYLRRCKAEGLRVMGLAASTKFNTVLGYYGIGPDLIECIGERSPEKVGLYTVGSGIPIVSEQYVRDAKPDVVVIGAWQFFDAILEREREMHESGTTFVALLPSLRVVPGGRIASTRAEGEASPLSVGLSSDRPSLLTT